MKKTCIISVFLLLLAIRLMSQSIVTLEECRKLAIENYPLIKQYQLTELAKDYTIANISKNYLPQFGMTVQASYQSEVTKLPLDMSSLPLPVDMPAISKDQYKAVLEASQLIWDGGTAAAQKEIAKANADIENRKVETNIYTINQKIEQLYFGILLINEQLEILRLTQENLIANKNITKSMFENGIAMQSDIDQIEVEILDVGQRQIEQESLRDSYMNMLSIFIHKQLDTNSVFQKPNDILIMQKSIMRPELSLYSSQINAMNIQLKAITAKNLPRINLFAQGGYERPGLNMLEDKFRFFAIGGVKLSWNFGNLYTKKNEKKLIENTISSIELQRETFLFNTNLEITKEQNEIEKMKKLLQKDNNIILLRNRVKKASESKYRNGTYRMNELIRDINAEAVARQSKSLHEIQYLMNIYNYKYLQGN